MQLCGRLTATAADASWANRLSRQKHLPSGTNDRGQQFDRLAERVGDSWMRACRAGKAADHYRSQREGAGRDAQDVSELGPDHSARDGAYLHVTTLGHRPALRRHSRTNKVAAAVGAASADRQDRRARVAPIREKTVVTVARVTEPALPDIRLTRADAQRDGDRTGVSYLPSAQVLAELACLGPDLRRLAADLRDRLSEADAQSQHDGGIGLTP
jgi:hypothetical protein